MPLQARGPFLMNKREGDDRDRNHRHRIHFFPFFFFHHHHPLHQHVTHRVLHCYSFFFLGNCVCMYECMCVCVRAVLKKMVFIWGEGERVCERDARGGGEKERRAREEKIRREKWELSRWKLNIIFTTYFSVGNWNLYPKITVYAFEIFNKNFRLSRPKS